MEIGAQTVQGVGFYPGSSRRFEAHVTVDPTADTVRLIDAETGKFLLICALSAVTVDKAAGQGPRQIYLPDNWLLQIEVPEDVAIFGEAPRNQLLRHFEEVRPRLIAVVAVAVMATWLVWKYGLTVIVAVAVYMTPENLRDYMDRGTMQSIDFVLADATNLSTSEQEKVRKIFDNIVAQVPQKQQRIRRFDLLFRDVEGMGPNAFALPGGTIVVTDQLVQEFGTDQDVIAGIIGHELAHTLQDHGLKQLYRGLSIYVLLAMIAGDLGPVLEDIALEGQVFVRLAFSRAHEAEADRIGVRLATEAGYDGKGLARFFETLQSEQLDLPWLSTHPSFERRIKEISEQN
ncbi:M48 family metallopeptidase [Shimia sp. R11_0]|uniref:M48 family metallopeptidase n=1 Tax=Shimia sp. R11_0 TaxID=2821096 RepID=UPI001AD957CB|nr:M48 family metallopeptidase [Shimia sp. R11_0]MBO9476134.1 M48 family metallopeptidase [Shimia sp. R11_0]